MCLGGGSALDAGKLAAVLLGSEEPVAAFRLAAKPLPEKSVPIICVPTTAGTGSEMTGISVISDAGHVKYWFWGKPLEADLALLDPELTVGLPARFTAMTGMDALVHAIEAATNRHAGPESDVAALAAIRLVVAHLPNAVREPQNLSARAGMLDAAALGGLAIHKAGTALAHNIGHALGSLAPVPHGLAVTLAMAATAEWVVEGNREGFARVAEAMGLGADADAVPGAFRRLASDVGLDLDTARRRARIDRRDARPPHGRAGKCRDAQIDEALRRGRGPAAARRDDAGARASLTAYAPPAVPCARSRG